MGGLSSKQQFQLVLTKLSSQDVDQEAHMFWDEVRSDRRGSQFTRQAVSRANDVLLCLFWSLRKYINFS